MHTYCHQESPALFDGTDTSTDGHTKDDQTTGRDDKPDRHSHQHIINHDDTDKRTLYQDIYTAADDGQGSTLEIQTGFHPLSIFQTEIASAVLIGSTRLFIIHVVSILKLPFAHFTLGFYMYSNFIDTGKNINIIYQPMPCRAWTFDRPDKAC